MAVPEVDGPGWKPSQAELEAATIIGMVGLPGGCFQSHWLQEECLGLGSLSWHPPHSPIAAL
jgi:hypothetical protein